MMRRTRNYEVCPEVLVNFFTYGKAFGIIEGIPEGAKFRGFAHNYQNNSISIFIEHDSFDEVHQSMCPPVFRLKAKEVIGFVP